MSSEGSKGEGKSKKNEEGGTSDKKHALLQKLDILRGMKRLKDKSKSGQGTVPPPAVRLHRTGTTIQPPSSAPISSRPAELPRSTSLKGVVSRPELVRSQSLHVWRSDARNDEETPLWAMMGDSSFQADMSRQGLVELPESLYNRTTLQILDIQLNKITALPCEIAQLTNLTVLVASHNQLTKLPKSLDKLGKLMILDLQSNRLTKLPKALGRMRTVSKLFLNSNRLAHFPLVLVHMHELQTLNLSYNFLASVPPDMCRMRSLKMVRLAGNFIRTLPPEFWAFEQLEKVDLSNNLLTSVPADLSHLKNLVELCIGYNKFAGFPEGLTTLPRVEVLSVEANGLETIPASIARLAPTLKKLHLMSNRLVDLPDHFRLLKNLDELDMRGNPLGQLGFGQGEWKKVLVELTSLKTLLTGAAPGQKAKVLLIQPSKSDNFHQQQQTQDEATKEEGLISMEERLQIPLGSMGRRARLKGVSAPPSARHSPRGNGEGNTFDLFRTMGGPRDASTAAVAATAKEDLLKQLGEAARGLQLSDENDDVDVEDEDHNGSGGRASVDSSDGETATGGGSRLSVASEDGEGAGHAQLLRELDEAEFAALPQRDDTRLVQEFCAVEDLNKPGLLRAKKDAIQQEDAHSEHVPLVHDRLGGDNGNDELEAALFCVFDGHGGKEAAHAALRLMPAEIVAQIKRHGRGLREDASEVLHRAFLAVDNKMAQFEYEGCTATVVLVWKLGSDRYLQAANAGDSSAFINCGNRVGELTREHKLGANEDERERMARTGIDVGEGQTRIGGGIAITRALGDHFAKDNDSGMIAVPHISDAIKLTPGVDTHLILASDGLWDVLSGRRALDLARPKSAPEAAQHLLRVALHSKECKDNVTVTVVRL